MGEIIFNFFFIFFRKSSALDRFATAPPVSIEEVLMIQLYFMQTFSQRPWDERVKQVFLRCFKLNSTLHRDKTKEIKIQKLKWDSFAGIKFSRLANAS